MTNWSFTLIMKNSNLTFIDPTIDDIAERLHNINNITVAARSGTFCISFDRDGDTLSEADNSGIKDVKAVGLEVDRIEMEPDAFFESVDLEEISDEELTEELAQTRGFEISDEELAEIKGLEISDEELADLKSPFKVEVGKEYSYMGNPVCVLEIEADDTVVFRTRFGKTSTCQLNELGDK